LLLFVIAIRITVTEMFRGIETSKATGLSAVTPWDTGSMWELGLLESTLAEKGEGVAG
jgi:hypothetical protein